MGGFVHDTNPDRCALGLAREQDAVGQRLQRPIAQPAAADAGDRVERHPAAVDQEEAVGDRDREGDDPVEEHERRCAEGRPDRGGEAGSRRWMGRHEAANAADILAVAVENPTAVGRDGVGTVTVDGEIAIGRWLGRSLATTGTRAARAYWTVLPMVMTASAPWMSSGMMRR